MVTVQPVYYPTTYYFPQKNDSPRYQGQALNLGAHSTPSLGSVANENECPGSDKASQKGAVKDLAQAASYFGAGMLLHRLPARVPKDGFKTMLPSDWKVWARVLLGIAATQKVNHAFDWHPAPWLGALQAVAIINPLAAGFTLNNLKQTAVMAPLVATVVQGASEAQKRLSPTLQEKWDVAPPVTQLGLSALLGVGAMLVYPRFYKMVATSGMLGQAMKKEAAQTPSALASATFSTCARGCSMGSFICLSELADIVGSFGNWFHSATGKQTSADKANQGASNGDRHRGVSA